MKLKLFGTDFSVSYPAVAFLCLAVISDKIGNILICLISSFLHELGHIFAMKTKGVRIESVAFNIGDVIIKADSSSLSYLSEIFISSAGVTVNFLLAIIFYLLFRFSEVTIFYTFFVSNLAIGIFNLLPVRFLDGGDILRLIFNRFFSQKSTEIILTTLTIIFMLPILITGLIFLFNSSYNYSLLFAAIYLICTFVSKEFKNVS